MEEKVITILVQGGAVSIALLAIWVIYKMQNGQSRSMLTQMDEQRKAFGVITEAHRLALERNTDAWVKNTEAIATLTEKMSGIRKTLKKK
jgi:hypothetical protein